MEPERRKEIFEGLENCSFSFKELQIEISRLSYFPNENSQVLVANIPLSSQLQSLYNKVEEIVSKVGFGMTIRTFKLHITLARFKEKNRPFSEIVELKDPIKTKILSLDVYESKFESGKTAHSLVKSYSFA